MRPHRNNRQRRTCHETDRLQRVFVLGFVADAFRLAAWPPSLSWSKRAASASAGPACRFHQAARARRRPARDADVGERPDAQARRALQRRARYRVQRRRRRCRESWPRFTARQAAHRRGRHDARQPRPRSCHRPGCVDVSHSGTACLEEGTAPVLWREAAANAARVTITPADRAGGRPWTGRPGADALPWSRRAAACGHDLCRRHERRAPRHQRRSPFPQRSPTIRCARRGWPRRAARHRRRRCCDAPK